MTDPGIDPLIVQRVISRALGLPAADAFWPRAEHPKTLHHYTDAHGVSEIIRTGIVWATHFQYLNDPNEGHHLWTLLRTEFEAEAGASSPATKEMPDTLERLRADVLQFLVKRGPATRESTPYVASFSADADQLGQWRAYGDDGRGYSVGVSYCDVVRAVIGETWSPGVQIMRVEYDEEVQKHIVKQVVDTSIAAMEEPYLDARDNGRRQLVWNSGVNALVKVLTIFSAGMKDRAYAHEQEWRLVADLIDPGVAISKMEADPLEAYGKANLDPVRMRTRNGLLIPYVEVNLRRVAGCQALESITVGPRSPLDLVIGPLKLLLRRADLVGVTVRGSAVPYRG